MLSTDYKRIPVLIMQGLSRYAEKHQPVGSFLQAVLTFFMEGVEKDALTG